MWTKVQVQDFYQLRDECKAADRLFEDPVFPARDSSLFFSKKPQLPITWQRPHVSKATCIDHFTRVSIVSW
jgi:calpain